MSHPVLREHDLAVVERIRTHTGRPVGYAEAPPGALAALTAGTGPGYCIVDPIPGGSRSGSVVDPYTDIVLHYQVRCIDRGPEGVRYLSDQIEPALASLTVPNRSLLWVTPTVPSGVWEDPDTANPSLWFSTPTFRIGTTP